MKNSPHRPGLRRAAACAAGLLLSFVLESAAALEPVAQEPVTLAVTLEPPRPHAWQCGFDTASAMTRVQAGDLLRLRVAAILPNGRPFDVTGSTGIQYSIDNEAAGVAPDGWIRFYPGKRVRHVKVILQFGRARRWESFAVISPGPVDLPEGVRALVAKDFPTLRIPDDTDITYEWLIEEGGDPFVSRADLDGNGLEDIALVLLGASEWKIVVFNQTSRGVFATAFVEEGKHGPGTPLACPQQITFPSDPGTSHALYVEIIQNDVFNIRWDGTHYIHENVDYGE